MVAIIPYSYHDAPNRELTSAYTRATDFVADLPIKNDLKSWNFSRRVLFNVKTRKETITSCIPTLISFYWLVHLLLSSLPGLRLGLRSGIACHRNTLRNVNNFGSPQTGQSMCGLYSRRFIMRLCLPQFASICRPFQRLLQAIAYLFLLSKIPKSLFVGYKTLPILHLGNLGYLQPREYPQIVIFFNI